MNFEKNLKKDGITVIEPLDNSSVISIAQNVSQSIYKTFPNLGFTQEELFDNFSKVSMYIANIPEGMSEASYFYKNSSIYFRDGMGLSDLEKYSVHEFIHHLQEQKDKKGNLVRLGLCTFKGNNVSGMGLNEAAVQLIASNVLGSTFEKVTYYDITFSTISPNCYPLLCNLITQMSYVTGEEILFDSTFNSNDYFKNKFIALCGENVYNQVSTNSDKILNLEEKIIILNNKVQSDTTSFAKAQAISEKILELKNQIRNTYFSTQELITRTYFSTVFKSLITSADLDRFRKNLYNFQELTGTSTNYYFFNNFYIEMMENLDKKYDILSNIETESTYLIPRKENKFIKLINYIKKIILRREFEKS